MKPKIDLNEAQKFLNALGTSPDENFVFQTFDDQGKDKSLAKIFCGTFEDCAEELIQMNQKGAGVFVTVNITRSASRAASNVVGLRALFVDKDDGNLPERLELEPSIIVQSKNGQHAYWLLVEDENIKLFKHSQQELAKKLNTDKSINDLSRVMRIPGFIHQKNPESPFLVRILEVNEKRYSIADVAEAFELSIESKKTKKSGKPKAYKPKQIAEGSRNTTLTSLAGKLRRDGLEHEEILSVLRRTNLEKCVAPLDETEIESIAESVSKYENDSDEQVSQSQANILISLVQGHDFFKTSDNKAFVSLPMDGHVEVLPLNSTEFRNYLSRKYYLTTKSVPKQQVLNEVLGVLSAMAIFEGRVIPLAHRIGGNTNLAKVDLVNSDWKIVEITPNGWSIKLNAVPQFTRPQGMLALPEPIPGGNIQELRKFLNVSCDDDWVLILSWLVAALCPKGPYPILVLVGEQGSSKSTTAKVLRNLVDPYRATLRATPRSEQDLSISANNSWVLAFDNLSGMPQWLSDALCRMSTGGGLAGRKLYSDSDEIIFDFQRPIILNGIDEVATRPDLLDRSIVVTLPTISEGNRKRETDFWKEFEEARPRILGALYNAVATAMRQMGDIKFEKAPRMIDFCVWASAASGSLGFTQDQFMNAIFANRSRAIQTGIESSTVAQAVMSYMENQSFWKGSASELLLELQPFWEEAKVHMRDIPRNGQRLADELRRLAPNLRTFGIDILLGDREGGSGKRLVKITNSQASKKRKLPSA